MVDDLQSLGRHHTPEIGRDVGRRRLERRHHPPARVAHHAVGRQPAFKSQPVERSPGVPCIKQQLGPFFRGQPDCPGVAPSLMPASDQDSYKCKRDDEPSTEDRQVHCRASWSRGEEGVGTELPLHSFRLRSGRICLNDRNDCRGKRAVATRRVGAIALPNGRCGRPLCPASWALH